MVDLPPGVRVDIDDVVGAQQHAVQRSRPAVLGRWCRRWSRGAAHPRPAQGESFVRPGAVGIEAKHDGTRLDRAADRNVDPPESGGAGEDPRGRERLRAVLPDRPLEPVAWARGLEEVNAEAESGDVLIRDDLAPRCVQMIDVVRAWRGLRRDAIRIGWLVPHGRAAPDIVRPVDLGGGGASRTLDGAEGSWRAWPRCPGARSGAVALIVRSARVAVVASCSSGSWQAIPRVVRGANELLAGIADGA